MIIPWDILCDAVRRSRSGSTRTTQLGRVSYRINSDGMAYSIIPKTLRDDALRNGLIIIGAYYQSGVYEVCGVGKLGAGRLQSKSVMKN